MSRIGKQPITLPEGVEVSVGAGRVTVKGRNGELSAPLFDGITVAQEGNRLLLSCARMNDRKSRSRYGLARALLANCVTGVSQGFRKTLELHGVGYRAALQGNKLNLTLGFSHPVVYELPQGVTAKVEQNRIVIEGADKQQVGQVAAEIRAFRPPEPYKGKGVRYAGEQILMKEGKKA
ncbi:MAG: 50S ribosomal protein L6 [Zetaproteobacteria bacterium]|nr:MAG: 50S ribosomal protein L6 [Zetaproteobacteria bacterium]